MSGDVTAAIERLQGLVDARPVTSRGEVADLRAVLAEVERLRAEREALVAARGQHPACDVHDDGPITCGWKSVVRDIDAVLAADPEAENHTPRLRDIPGFGDIQAALDRLAIRPKETDA